MKINNITKKTPRYDIHKYWGKKPQYLMDYLIKKYSKEGDVLFDPFSGYGGFIFESIANRRRVISNDLNPFSIFLQRQIINVNYDEDVFVKTFQEISSKWKSVEDNLYKTTCKVCGSCDAMIVSSLRNNEDDVLINKLKCSCSNKFLTQEFDIEERVIFKEFEDVLSLKTPSHPCNVLKRNSRISITRDCFTSDDLFTVRSLYAHSFLWNIIMGIKDEDIRDMMLVVFTSNIANCSKLVPPIKSRGEMSQGSWLTGFYIPDNYIENNVFHYFVNRFKKFKRGKGDVFKSLHGYKVAKTISEFYNDKESNVLLLNEDAKRVNLSDESVDYIFTDFPYGGSVPYFEQCALWNTWLNFDVDYDNEIVISDSIDRLKNEDSFEKDMVKAIRNIYRILKCGGYFTLTYHSLNSREWYFIILNCIKLGFKFESIHHLSQKTSSPRQLNRENTVKSDVVITLQKGFSEENNITMMTEEETKDLIKVTIDKSKSLDVNYFNIIKAVMERNSVFYNMDIVNEIKNNL